MEVARQFVRDNNGRMLLSTAYLKKRGWFSAGAIHKAKHELLDAGFIFETVKGHRPNKASWYAMTWRALDKHPAYDAGAEQLFTRGAYRSSPGKEKRPPPTCKNPKKSRGAILADGTSDTLIVPANGMRGLALVPPYGAVGAVRDALSIPLHGNHLEMPSVDAREDSYARQTA